MNSFFNDYAPVRRDNQRCCYDPYCENNTRQNVRKQRPVQRSAFDSHFDFDWDRPFSGYNRDPFFKDTFSSNFFKDEQPTQNRRVRTARTRAQNEPVYAKKNAKKNQDGLRRSAYEEFDNKENKAPKTENQAPKFYSTVFQSNSVNQNGQKTTINKKQYKDNETSETFVTKITEDKDGNRNVEKLDPRNYNSELKTIMEQMEETGAVLMDITPKTDSEEEDSHSVKMLEENSHSLRSKSGDRISNTKDGNNMF